MYVSTGAPNVTDIFDQLQHWFFEGDFSSYTTCFNVLIVLRYPFLSNCNSGHLLMNQYPIVVEHYTRRCHPGTDASTWMPLWQLMSCNFPSKRFIPVAYGALGVQWLITFDSIISISSSICC